MITGISSSLAALYAFGSRLAGTANNVANVSTNGYKKTVATITETDQGLPQTNLMKSDTPGPLIQIEGLLKETSNVNLAEEIPQMTIGRRAYEANVKALKTQLETTESLMEIIA